MIQSVVFPKSKYNTSTAYSWLSHHNIEPMLGKRPDVEQNTIRFRIQDPRHYSSFYSKKLSDGVILVYGR